MAWQKRLVVLLGMVLLSVPSIGLSQAGLSEVVPGSRAAGLDACVAPTEDMRRNHMEHLLHKRDKTMRQGIRTLEFSLNECVSCHVAKNDTGQFTPIADEGQFCQSCHKRVGQKIDCFQCHRTTPES